MSAIKTIQIQVNGVAHTCHVEPRTTLVDLLRGVLSDGAFLGQAQGAAAAPAPATPAQAPKSR